MRPQPGPGRGSSDYGDLVSQFLARCARGDVKSFAHLYDATIGWVYCLACRSTDDAENAQRLTGLIYQRIWRHSARFDVSSPCAVAWLLRQVSAQIASTGGHGCGDGTMVAASPASALADLGSPASRYAVRHDPKGT